MKAFIPVCFSLAVFIFSPLANAAEYLSGDTFLMAKAVSLGDASGSIDVIPGDRPSKTLRETDYQVHNHNGPRTTGGSACSVANCLVCHDASYCVRCRPGFQLVKNIGDGDYGTCMACPSGCGIVMCEESSGSGTSITYSLKGYCVNNPDTFSCSSPTTGLCSK